MKRARKAIEAKRPEADAPAGDGSEIVAAVEDKARHVELVARISPTERELFRKLLGDESQEISAQSLQGISLFETFYSETDLTWQRLYRQLLAEVGPLPRAPGTRISAGLVERLKKWSIKKLAALPVDHAVIEGFIKDRGAPVVAVVESQSPEYTGGHGGTLKDAYEIERAHIVARVRSMPREKLPALSRLLDDFERTNGEVAASRPKEAPRPAAAATETTTRTKQPPRPDWIEARARGVKLADFINENFADDLETRTMTRAKLRGYASLYGDYYNHLDQLPRDLQSIPTKSKSIKQQVREGKIAIPPVRPDEVRRYERDVKRVASASRA